MSGSLKRKVLVGGCWLYMLEGCSKVLLIMQTVILARLLMPEDFGIVGIFFIVSVALENFTKTGFNKALIQRNDINNRFLDTAWTVSIIRGILLFAILFIFSPVIVEFLNAPNALMVVRVLGISLMLKGFQNVGVIYFSKELNFKKEFFLKSGANITNFLISVPLAFTLRNEWAIVFGLLGSDMIGLILSFYLSSYRPRLAFDYNIFRNLFTYSKWLLLSSMVVFFSKQMDKVFVTKLLGEISLGIYVVAWRFARIPELLSKPIPNALFPAYSKYQNNPSYMKEKYIETLKYLSVFALPLVAGIVVMAKSFVYGFLGDKWAAAVLPMQILTVAIGLNLITSTSLSLFNAMGRTSFNFKVNIVKLIALIMFAYPLVIRYGVMGAAASYLMLSAVGLLVWKIEILDLLGFKLKDLKVILFSALTTTVMVAIILLANSIVVINNNIINFVMLLFLSIVTYVSAGCLIDKVLRYGFYQNIVSLFSLLKPLEKGMQKNV